MDVGDIKNKASLRGLIFGDFIRGSLGRAQTWFTLSSDMCNMVARWEREISSNLQVLFNILLLSVLFSYLVIVGYLKLSGEVGFFSFGFGD